MKDHRTFRAFLIAGAVLISLAARPITVAAQDSTLDKAGRIASQPARDVGAAKTKIPPILQAAAANPYSRTATKTCRQILTEIAQLTEVLGPDFGTPKKENEAGQIAQAGGETVVNSLIPFRGVVREVSGAAAADRRLTIATQAGFARRGYLRGLQTARHCVQTQ